MNPPAAEDSLGEGESLADAGDVNGDDLSDLVIGDASEDANGRPDSGSAWVIFGRGERATIDRRSNSNGFRIDGGPGTSASGADPCPLGDCAGARVAPAGDVNADGRDDLLIAAPGASPLGRLGAGAVYVVFGKASSDPVDLGALGPHGYRIEGARAEDRAGVSIAGAGDVNGDGRPDALLSGHLSGVYVVFGKSTTETLDLADLQGNGYRIRPKDIADGQESAMLDPEWPVAGGGDINGDGRADVIIGDPWLDTGYRLSAGSAYVVFGQGATGRIDLSKPGPHGYRIRGTVEDGFLGMATAGAGDFTGDGRGDVLLSAPGEGEAGRVYVVPGQGSTRSITLGPGTRSAFTIDGDVDVGDEGAPLAGAGDLNGDGRADVILGAPGYVRGCTTGAGAAYVVFGRRRPTTLHTRRLGRAGYRLDGRAAGEGAGELVSGAGDVDGDSRRDLLVATFRGQGRPWLVDVVSGRPRVHRRREVPPSGCLPLRVVDRGIPRILRTGGLRVRVGLRHVDSDGSTVRLRMERARRPALARAASEAPTVHITPPLASASVRFHRRGTRPVLLRLSRQGRRLLASRPRVRVKVVASQADDEGHGRELVLTLAR